MLRDLLLLLVVTALVEPSETTSPAHATSKEVIKIEMELLSAKRVTSPMAFPLGMLLDSLFS